MSRGYQSLLTYPLNASITFFGTQNTLSYHQHKSESRSRCARTGRCGANPVTRISRLLTPVPDNSVPPRRRVAEKYSVRVDTSHHPSRFVVRHVEQSEHELGVATLDTHGELVGVDAREQILPCHGRVPLAYYEPVSEDEVAV